MPRTTLRDGRTLHWSEGGDPVGTPVMFFNGCPDSRPPGEAPRMAPAYPRDDLDDAGREFFSSLATGSVVENVERVRPDFLAWRAKVDPDDPDDARVAARWFDGLPPTDRELVDGPAPDVAAAAREAIGLPDGYLADAALVFGGWPFRIEDIGCPVTLWYGDRDANAPPRNGEWLAERLTDVTLHMLPGQGHLESLMRSWERILPTATR